MKCKKTCFGAFFRTPVNDSTLLLPNVLFPTIVFLYGTEGKFVRALHSRLQKNLNIIKLGRRTGVFENADADSEMKLAATSLFNLMSFVQLSCEGHNLEMQNLWRHQTKSQNSLNILQSLQDMLVEFGDSSVTINRYTDIELDLTLIILKTLVEMCQGPCPLNQTSVLRSDVVVTLNHLMLTSIDANERREESDPLYVSIRGQSSFKAFAPSYSQPSSFIAFPRMLSNRSSVLAYCGMHRGQHRQRVLPTFSDEARGWAFPILC